jgi:hypothetical protein
MRRFVLLACVLALPVIVQTALAGTDRVSADWKVQAGKSFQRAGEYVVRQRNTQLQDAYDAFGEPARCKVVGSPSHVVATWPERGIWIEAVTYAALPSGESGCISPDLIAVSEIRLTDKRWVTSLGLRVGDRTTKLRRLYPKSPYHESRRNQYYLVWQHGPCIGVCSPADERFGVDHPLLTAQVRAGRVVAFWVEVFGQGE